MTCRLCGVTGRYFRPATRFWSGKLAPELNAESVCDDCGRAFGFWHVDRARRRRQEIKSPASLDVSFNEFCAERLKKVLDRQRTGRQTFRCQAINGAKELCYSFAEYEVGQIAMCAHHRAMYQSALKRAEECLATGERWVKDAEAALLLKPKSKKCLSRYKNAVLLRKRDKLRLHHIKAKSRSHGTNSATF